ACIAMATHPQSKTAKVLGLAPIVWIGTRSYAIYLWHWPVYVLTRPGIDVPWSAPETFVVRLVITGVLAELSYRLIDKPIRSGPIHVCLRGLGRRPGGAPPGGVRRTAGPATGLGGAVLMGGVGLASAGSRAGEVERSTRAGEVPPRAQPPVAPGPDAPPTTA